MTFGSRLVGWLLFLLGLIGTLICIALLTGTWYAQQRLHRMNQQAFSVIDNGLEAVEIQIESVPSRLVEVEVRLSTLIVQHRISRALPGHFHGKAKEQILKELARVIELLNRCDDWIAIGMQTVQLTDQAITLIQSDSKNESRKLAELQETLESMRQRLKNSTERIEELAYELNSVDPADLVSSLVIQKLGEHLPKLFQSFGQLRPQVTRFLETTHALNDEARVIRTKIDRWLLIGAFIATVAELWVGLGQLALIQMGLRRIRGIH